MAGKNSSSDGPITIKKYANRRLYNTATSSYVTLDHLAKMVKDGTDFSVYDAKTGEDITRSVLTQIIFEEEGKGQNLLPIKFLRQLIRFYGDSLQAFVPGYLEMSIDSFARNQEDMRKRLTSAFGGTAAFKDFDDHIRNNIAMFERAVRMFTPFPSAQGLADKNRNGEDPDATPADSNKDDEITELKNQLAAMQKQLDEIANKN